MVPDGVIYIGDFCLVGKTLYGYKAIIITIIANYSLVGGYLIKIAPQRVLYRSYPPAFWPFDSAKLIIGG